MNDASDTIEDRLTKMGLSLPASAPPRAMFLPKKISGGLLFLSGQICEWEGEPRYFGPIGPEIDMDTAQEAARMFALNLIFSARALVGSLSRIAGVVRLGGFVAAPPGYPDGPKVVDGASRLFVELWGEDGRHARTAVGVTSLPANALVEIDAVLELK